MNFRMNSTAELLSLAEIAGWQITEPPAKVGSIVASLPALQRSAVWKVRQIEELWDSILRRFPIGSFIIAPPEEKLKQKDFKLQSKQASLPTSTHLLLDGQQRATGIALGFYDLWTQKIDTAKSALWLDLAEAPNSRDVELVFRVITCAHPWGYKCVDPDETLSANQIRSALIAYQKANNADSARPDQFLLWQTWPWDSEAPIPLAVLIDAVTKHGDDIKAVRIEVWQRIKDLPIFKEIKWGKCSRPAEKSARDGLAKQRNALHKAFNIPESKSSLLLDAVIRRLYELVAPNPGYLVPALLLDLKNADRPISPSGQDGVETETTILNDATKKDAIELLFVRVNSAGTPLAGEELTYSLLKAAWPDAAKFIDGLDHKPAQASRIATFCVRLVLARQQRSAHHGKKLTMPPPPGVNEFRRLVRDQNPAHPEFLAELTSFIENDANYIFSAAWNFITGRDPKRDLEYVLLPVLAVELAQKSPDVYFLLLYWIDRLRQNETQLDQINEATHRRTLGFLTALAWFASDKNKACSAIWADLQADNKELIELFNQTLFKKACRLDERFNLRMIPLPSKDELEMACKKGVTGGKGCKHTITNENSAIWDNDHWNWYTSFSDKLIQDSTVKKKWLEHLKSETPALEEDEEPDFSESMLQSARHFADTLYNLRPILLYAQRNWLWKWYPNFDPSQPEYMEDKNRPWDYDHILPQNLLRTESGNSRRRIPQVIWDWCGSIGNLRAWPLEANRSDSDISPTLKLNVVNAEEKRYSMTVSEEVRSASFIDNNNWEHWKICVPMNENEQVLECSYLAKREYHDYRKALMQAIASRFVAIYREWYDKLNISDLH